MTLRPTAVAAVPVVREAEPGRHHLVVRHEPRVDVVLRAAARDEVLRDGGYDTGQRTSYRDGVR
jgi:hypothetical protein